MRKRKAMKAAAAQQAAREHAEANGLVILYPQARTTPLNPKACWDWWGYTGKQYACQYGLSL